MTELKRGTGGVGQRGLHPTPPRSTGTGPRKVAASERDFNVQGLGLLPASYSAASRGTGGAAAAAETPRSRSARLDPLDPGLVTQPSESDVAARFAPRLDRPPSAKTVRLEALPARPSTPKSQTAAASTDSGSARVSSTLLESKRERSELLREPKEPDPLPRPDGYDSDGEHPDIRYVQPQFDDEPAPAAASSAAKGGERKRPAVPSAAAAAAAEAALVEAPRLTFFPRTVLRNEVKGGDHTETFSLAFSPDSQVLAAGCGDGSIRVFSAAGKVLHHLDVPTVDQLPTTCVRFRPNVSFSKTKNLLLSSCADGTLTQWHMGSQTRVFSTKEEGNEIYTLEYRPDGMSFASAGYDAKVRVYDEQKKTLLLTLSAGRNKSTVGHTSRVYALRFRPGDGNTLVSGGWDNTVQIWDLRVGHSVRSIFGPHICGEALDLDPTGGTLLTGSWRAENALQLWDFKSGKLMQDLPWQQQPASASQAQAHSKRPEMLYCAAFSSGGDMIAGGGAGGEIGTNEARVFAASKFRLLDGVSTISRGVYCLAFAPDGSRLAVGGGDPIINVLDMAGAESRAKPKS